MPNDLNDMNDDIGINKGIYCSHNINNEFNHDINIDINNE